MENCAKYDKGKPQPVCRILDEAPEGQPEAPEKATTASQQRATEGTREGRPQNELDRRLREAFRNSPELTHEGLLDTTDILSLEFNADTNCGMVGMIYAAIQQVAAQLAAIRQMLEAVR